jgi:hypothetical protein
MGHTVLFSWYAQQPVNPDAGVYPAKSAVVEHPEQYLGEQVAVEGIVRETEPIVIAVRASDRTARVTITSAAYAPEVGDKLQVYGTLIAPTTIESINGFAVRDSGLWYAWIISFLAGLWVLFRLIRHWKLDLNRLRFTRREDPLTLQDLPNRERDTDA